ncbi:SpoIID/LytB domain-containing protein [Aggregicoccus sp. 17bor-14]|uniref:SpoIID/LytB domain-containing protein n=1 Tax=Myxococcaceae TaxID=31 RepID=UPI00129C24E0|nr:MULTISPECIES: SpoIID/LytB domain-containing protein [Myxococcaceae]MBF5045511.1 SpoIID/LytB domain-containing protein [Simulacricoccus sp. 17bor-14]MRI91248.1 SpoIID/LytB domain-containing protein [Aggregicoccus sp. 17bor-14]
MLRPVALLALLLASTPAAAVETMRISMGDVEGAEVRISGPGLRFGGDSEEGDFVRVGAAEARVRRRGGGGLEVNGAPILGDAVRFRAETESPDAGVAEVAPLRAGGREVRGEVVVRLAGTRLQLINVLPLEDYLAAVLGSEMPVSFPLEALKAQAVAARTYALQKKLEAYGSPFHMGSSVLHQVYGGMDREDARTRAAVAATRGQVLTYELAPIEAYFHASCGGRTESGAAALQRDLPYLKPVDCPCGELPASHWSAQVSTAEMDAALRFASAGLRTAARTATGRVSRVAAGARSLDAAQLRQRLGYTRIKSLSFDVERNAQGFRFTGRGYGHGAGLCQWGAKVLADRGQGYKDILAHYYPGAELQQLY